MNILRRVYFLEETFMSVQIQFKFTTKGVHSTMGHFQQQHGAVCHYKHIHKLHVSLSTEAHGLSEQSLEACQS